MIGPIVVLVIALLSGGGPAQPGTADAPVFAPAANVHLAPPLIGGRATWYRAAGDIGAAGPALREYLGPHWRGTFVSVCSSQCLVVQLADWCSCRGSGGRLIDLSDDAFAYVAGSDGTPAGDRAALGKGVIPVEITRAVHVPAPPATDTAP